ncbi:MAG: hypothetical protein ABH811_01600 [archaeon]
MCVLSNGIYDWHWNNTGTFWHNHSCVACKIIRDIIKKHKTKTIKQIRDITIPVSSSRKNFIAKPKKKLK